MASSEVKVSLGSGHEVVLTTDNPDIGALVEKIVSLRDVLDVDKIVVTCESAGFDKESFAEVVQDSCRQFLDAIRLEKEQFDKILLELKSPS